MKKVLAVALICVTLLLAVGCMGMDKEQAEALKNWQESIASKLDYEAEVSCWKNTKGGIAVNIKPLNQDATLFGNNIICGVRAVSDILGAQLSTLTIGFADENGTVIFTKGDTNYGLIMDGHTEEVYQYATEADLASDYPAVTEYIAGLK